MPRTTTPVTDKGTFNPKDSNFFDILTKLLRGGDNNALLQLLYQLSIQQDAGLTGGQRDDWNKQLLDNLLSYQNTQENRAYNVQLRDEQRVYDSPTNQLARLMGAGISRDAAIQLLSGAGGSGGSGVPFSDPAALAAGLSPTQSALNEVQSKTAIANSVFGGISAITGLLNLGFTAPAALQQVEFMKNQNFLTGQQINAYNSAGQAFAILNSAGAAADAFGSVGAAADSISNLAKDGNRDAAAFISNGGISAMKQNAPFASRTLSDLYKSERSSNDYAAQFDLSVRQQRASAALDEISYEQVVQEIDNLSAEYVKILSETDFIEQNRQCLIGQSEVLKEQAELLRKQGRNVDADTYLKKAEKLRADAETEGFGLANNVERTFQNTIFGDEQESKTGLDWLTSKRLQDLYGDCKTLSSLRSNGYFEEKALQMLSDTETITAVNMLRYRRANSSFEYAKEHPVDAKFGWAIEDCGLGVKLDAAANKSHIDIKGVPFATPEYDNLLNQVNDERDKHKKPWYLRNHK